MKRFHALDSLRAAMMLLGIWLHTVVGYSRDGGWPYKDAHPTAMYDWTLGIIHSFRMPLFFLLAGFFGALLWQRGWRAFVTNRLSRILLPFVLFWMWMWPAVSWMAAYSRSWQFADGVNRATQYVFSGAFLQRPHPGHLWFLEYLLVLYAIAFVSVWALEASDLSFAGLNSLWRSAVASPWRPVLFAIPSACALMLMPGGFLEDPPGFIPVPRIVLAYTIPFFFGWLLFRNRDLLGSFERHAWRQIGFAFVLVVGWMVVMDPLQHRPEYWIWVKPLRSFAVSLLMWLFAFGLTGLFLRYLSAERPLGRYLADGSYWIYIMHMPVVILFQMAFAPVAWSAAVKVPIVVLLASAVLVWSYDACVRSTWIGVLLNGRRYERWFAAQSSTASISRGPEVRIALRN
jgi:glucans biosynthesis protein C